jgi:pimeloyl-ACP methyl ester carboxylesterase
MKICCISALFIIYLVLTSCATTIKYASGTSESINGITSLENIKLNGLKHAVLIRGKNLNNPILLHIHGMGIPSMCFAFDEYTGTPEKEEKFTVVHYDQRGFGKTYHHGKHRKKFITSDQYLSDAEELIKYLQHRFGKQKIYLLAESWGTAIGAKLVSKHPEWFYAYIAVPQIGNVKEYLEDAYDFSMQSAKADSNTKAMEELIKVGKPTTDQSKKELNKSIAVVGKWMDFYNLKRYNGQDMTGYFFKSLWQAPEYNLFDFKNTLNGIMKTAPRLNMQLVNTDIYKEVQSMNVPVYFIIGEYDLFLNTSKEYFDQLQADKKYWIPIKNAAHMVRGEQYQVFDSLLYNKILPETLVSPKTKE